jgi:glutamate/tyrosine decarboxylase-like PLP-dependent enzyme
VLHADGAWGTYFHTTLHEDPNDHRGTIDFVPSIALKEETQASLRHLRECDSVTVDPHKSGYIQYPAGGLLYRDERMRYLVTWTSPVVNRAGEESIGIYGIEGRYELVCFS